MKKPRVYCYSSRGQFFFLVLYSLRELGGACTKREVLNFVQNADLYEITRHDLPPFENQNEPRYHTLLAWARKDALISGWLIDTSERDSWQLSRNGRDVLDRFTDRYRKGVLSVSNCYLWTPKFKKQVDFNYQPSSADKVRPEDVQLYY
jgi:hypothetical protein